MGMTLNIVDTNNPNLALQPPLINSHSALSVPSYWRGVNFLVDNLTSFPRSVRSPDAGDMKKHPLRRLLRLRPNQYQIAYHFFRTLFYHTVARGNGYARIIRARGEVTGLMNYMPGDVVPFRYESQQWYFHEPTRSAVIGSDMIHLYGLGYDGMVGYEPVQVLHETFGRAKTIDRYQTRFLQKGSIIRGTIEIPSGVSTEQIEMIRTALRQYKGPDSEQDILVLSDGAKMNNSTLTPQQSQLFEQGAFTTKQIAQVLGVPPQFLYEFGESKYNNSIEQMGQDVVRYTFRPWIEQIEQEFTVKLLTDDEQIEDIAVKLNPDALLKGDTKTQSANVLAEVNGGLRTPNEGRKLLGMPPDKDPINNKLRLPTNLVANTTKEDTGNDDPKSNDPDDPGE